MFGEHFAIRLGIRFNHLTMNRFVALILIALTVVSVATALEKPETELIKAGLTQKLGGKVSLETPFLDSNGMASSIESRTISGKPTILIPAYYHCPRLCGLLLNGVKRLISTMSLTLGEDYSVVTVSFDPSDTLKNAELRKNEFSRELPEVSRNFWSFLIGTAANIRIVMDQIGFKYMEDQGEYAHSAAIIILTPEGKISQYFTGIEFNPFDVKLALIEASGGKIGTPVDHVLLYCFRFDPTKGKYTWAAFNVMRVGGILCFLLLATLIYRLWRKETRLRTAGNV